MVQLNGCITTIPVVSAVWDKNDTFKDGIGWVTNCQKVGGNNGSTSIC